MLKLGCQRAAIQMSAVVLWLLFMLFLTILRRIQSGIFESSVRRCKNVLIMYLFVLTSRKKTLMASFRPGYGRLTATSFTHRNAPFLNGLRIDRVAQFRLPRALRVPYAR